MKTTTQQPLKRNGLVQLITVGNSIHINWVKAKHCVLVVHVRVFVTIIFLTAYFRFGSKMYRQSVGIPMGTKLQQKCLAIAFYYII